MLERTNYVRDVNKNYDVSIPSELKPYFERGDHYRVYHDAETGAIAYVPNICSIESKFMRNIASGNEPKRKKYILRFDCDNEAYLSLTDEQVYLFDWLRDHQIVDPNYYELIPFNENISWVEV